MSLITFLKILFLDIDGVLNSRTFYKKRAASGIWYAKEDYIKEQFDPDAVARLNQIIEATGAQICVSSTWRLSHSVFALQKIFNDVGIKGEIVGKTQNLSGDHKYPRGYEIEAWINAGNVQNYVVLEDDVVDMDMLKGHVIRTTFEYGLLDKHVETAIKILNPE